jgi:hypothetical protein
VVSSDTPFRGMQIRYPKLSDIPFVNSVAQPAGEVLPVV